MGRPSGTRRSYDAIAATYAAQLGDELAGKPLDRALLGVVAESAGAGVVLDAGCGPAHVAAALAAGGIRVLGVDLSTGMVRAATVPAVAGDLVALPVGTGTVAVVVCWYAVIHLDEAQRAAAYREFARVLAPGGLLSLAFHVSDAEHATGGVNRPDRMWGTPVDLAFRYPDPAAEAAALGSAGLRVSAQLERAAYLGGEHPSRRAYLLATRAP